MPLLLFALLLLAAAGRPEAARAEVVVVTTASDVFDAPDVSSIATLQADPGPAGKISLCEAIHAANNTPGTDDVTFSIDGIGPRTIQIQGQLTVVTDPIRINGTCSGGPCIQLRGSGVLDGLIITAGQSVVEGLLLNSFRVGLLLSGSGSNVVKRCYVGVDLNGTSASGNTVGIQIESANNSIGTGMPGDANLISGNIQDGVLISGSGATGNQVRGNLIGTDATGMAPLENRYGIAITAGASDNAVGGASGGARNVISGNTEAGVHISGEGTSSNRVLGNYIGTAADGTTALSNGGYGVHISGGSSNTIGGTAVGSGNVIAGNAFAGIRIVGLEAQNNRVLGNFIGTNPANADLGNDNGGIRITNAPNNVIGLPGLGGANTIGFNDDFGVVIEGAAALGSVVQSNFIGASRDGVDIGNGGFGVGLDAGASGNTIGGLSDGRGNVIAYSDAGGIIVVGSDTKRNGLLRNSIHSNFVIGIDLGNDGPTADDPGDGDGGPNDLQNHPELSAATAFSGGLFVEGFLSSKPNTVYRVELFSSAEAYLPGHGHGQRYLGALDVATDALGVAPFTFAGPAVAVGHHVTATATDPDRNTSEFSDAVEVTDDTPSQTVTFDDDVGDGDVTNPANWSGDVLPTPNDTAQLPAGSTAVLGAGDAFQVRQLDVFGAVGSPTTFTLLGTLTAEVVRQFAFTTVTMDGGTAIVENTTNTGGMTAFAGAATLTSKFGTGSFTATSGATVAVDGTGITVDVGVTTTNVTLSGTPGSALTIEGRNTFNATTKFVNTDPGLDAFVIDVNGDTDLNGNTDLGLGVVLDNGGTFVFNANLRGASDGAGTFVNDGFVEVLGNRTVNVAVENNGIIEILTANRLTLTGGGLFDDGSTFTVDGATTLQRPFGSGVIYVAAGDFDGTGTVVVRAPLQVSGGTFGQNLTLEMNGPDALLAGTGDDVIDLPTVTVAGTGGVIDGGDLDPDPGNPSVSIGLLTDNTTPITTTLTLRNGAFALAGLDIPATSTFANLTLDNADLIVTGQAVVDDFFEFRRPSGGQGNDVIIGGDGSFEVGNEATVTFFVPLTVARDGLQHGAVFVGPGATLALRGGGNFQGGEGQLVLDDDAAVVVGAEVGATSTVNFSTTPTTTMPPVEGTIVIEPNGEVDFSNGEVDTRVHFRGGTVLPQPVVVYRRLVLYESGRTLAGSVFRGGITTTGLNDFPVEADVAVGAGGPATFGTDVVVNPGVSLTIGDGGTGEIVGFHDFIAASQARGEGAATRGGAAVRRGAAARGGVGVSGGEAALVVEAGGRFAKTGGGVTDLLVPVVNAGSLLAEDGTFVVRSTLDSPGLLGGAGAFDVTNGTVTVAGPVSPGLSSGTLTWTGDYGPEPSATLVAELGGLTPGAEHDVLAVSGSATLAGALDLRLLDGYAPEVGDAFTVLTAASVTGAFSEVIAPPGYAFDVAVGATEVVVTAAAVPAPSPVVVTMEPEEPPIVLPPSGGPFTYRVTLTNTTGQPQTVQGWVEAVLPNGSVHGPLVGPKAVALQPGQTLGPVRFRQRVPAVAPPGQYVVRVRVGEYPDAVVSEDTFTFEKEAPPLAFQGGEAPAGQDARRAIEVPASEGWESEELADGEPLLAAKAPPVPEVATVPEAASSAEALPEEVALHPATPNPFGGATTLRFDLPEAGAVRLVVYDVLGRAVARLVDGEAEAGAHAVAFDGEGLASGPYVVRLEAGGVARTQRMTLVR